MGTGTGIGRVRGLGSAKSGAHHWWLQRATAAGNILLVSWFVVSLLLLPSLDYETVVKWIHAPLTAVPLLLLIVNVFWHFRMGIQVSVEDYLHDDGARVAFIILLNFYTVGAAALAVFAVLKIAFTGAPA
jgi:succinate dehydrogenase / fumarate reductase membrane anchor subunit